MWINHQHNKSTHMTSCSVSLKHRLCMPNNVKTKLCQKKSHRTRPACKCFKECWCIGLYGPIILVSWLFQWVHIHVYWKG
jgi:hypothetical protein